MAYTRRDGREYLYRYRDGGEAVCSPRCDKKIMADVYDRITSKILGA
jgi:hypothetical protein